jgi:outer membrane protein
MQVSKEHIKVSAFARRFTMAVINKLILGRSRLYERQGFWPFIKIFILSFAALSLTGCVTLKNLSRRTADSPQTTWTAPAKAAQQQVSPPSPLIPAELRQSQQSWTLANLVDIGLANNLQTRAAWNAARSASAALGAVQSTYYPWINAVVSGARSKTVFAGGQFKFTQTTLNPMASVSFLLFDFGGRKASTEQARQTLQAANWMQNSSIQNVILQIESAYYQYLAAKALLKAQEISLKGAQANYDAASERHRVGVATIADVLQAKTALSRVELDMVTAQGAIQTLHGVLANSLGLAANTSFEVIDELPEQLPLERVSEQVDLCIKEAESQRPDLAASRALVLGAEAQIHKAQSNLLPSFAASGSIGQIYYNNVPQGISTFSVSILMNIPIFNGFQYRYQLLQAKANAELVKAEMIKLEQDVVLQVWTSFYSLKTSEQRIKTSQDLLESAMKSYDVALGRYKEGVGSILDLLSAQSLLENGRVQVIQAKTDWFLSLVQFAHDTGTLGLPEKKTGLPAQSEKGDN